MYSRHISPLLVEALADTPVVLLNGARQTGKSTLAQSLAASGAYRYLTLDDRVVFAAARDDPVGFVAGLSGPVILDEIQRVPEIFLPIKAEVDRDRRPGRFLFDGFGQCLAFAAYGRLVGRAHGGTVSLALIQCGNSQFADFQSRRLVVRWGHPVVGIACL